MALIRCAACQSPLPDDLFSGQTAALCRYCGKTVHGYVLPALYKAPGGVPPVLPGAQPQEGQATCFYSPNRPATKVCEHCGVFISDAWAAQWGNMTVCLKCLDSLRNKSSDQRFEASRVLWDNIALSLAVTPLILAALFLCTGIGYFFSAIFVLLTIVSAPAAIFVALRFWNSPRSIVPRGHLRQVIALLTSVIVIGFWILGIGSLVDLAVRH